MSKMRIVGLLVVASVVLAACQSPMSRDIDLPNEMFTSSVEFDPEKVSWGVPDQIDLFYNLDQHPNIVRICIDGVALMTTTREYGDATTLVPEWNDYCATQDNG